MGLKQTGGGQTLSLEVSLFKKNVSVLSCLRMEIGAERPVASAKHPAGKDKPEPIMEGKFTFPRGG